MSLIIISGYLSRVVDNFGYRDAKSSNILKAISPVPPAMSKIFIPGRTLSCSTNFAFHRRCAPTLITSFIRSYDFATFSKTLYTLFTFSSSSTSLYPKCVYTLLLSSTPDCECPSHKERLEHKLRKWEEVSLEVTLLSLGILI